MQAKPDISPARQARVFRLQGRLLQEVPLKAQLLKYWNRIQSSFWFIPTLMISASIAAAFGLLAVDHRIESVWLSDWSWTIQSDATAASNLLQTVATAMITITSIVFSMTLVVLSLTSTQFGPRLISHFMRDYFTQFTLGTFTSTFLYCLIILQSIHVGDNEIEAFVPQLSVLSVLVIAVINVFVLIYFIHHISVSIQAQQVLGRIGCELNRRIERLFPDEVALGDSTEAPAPGEIPEHFERESMAIPGEEDGYVERVEVDELLAVACREQLLIRIFARPGDYVTAGRPLCWVWPGERLNDKLAHEINLLFAIETQRSPGQDIAFMINEMVEMALRALSPSLNDPWTAMGSLDRLGSALYRLAQCREPGGYQRDDKGQLRLIAPVVDFPAMVDAAFNPIRQNSRANVQVTLRMLEVIAVVAHGCSRPEQRQALHRQADMIAEGARENFATPADLRAMESRYQKACALLSN